LQYVKKLQGGTGSCAIFGADFSTSSAIAAFANAAQAQIHDANDGFIWAEAKNTCCHPGRLIVPAAIAWAESYGASGKELIAAVVAGYEFTGRAQKMTQLTRDTYVAALVAGKLAGLNADKLSQALIMAAYNSPGRTGIPSPWIDEYWLSNGQAVRVGLEAVMMIQAGFHTSDIRNSKTMPWNMDGNSLGDRWMTLDTYIKLYPCCLNIQESIDLALSLTKQNKLHGSDISRIDISRWWGLYVGSERLEPGAGRMRAQLNIFYCVASAVSNGKFDQNNFTPASIADEKVRSLANKVFLHQLPKEQIKPDMPFGFTRMTITTNDGKQVEGIEEYSPGHSQLSIPPDKLRTMCLERFGLVLPEAQSKILYDAIQRLEEYDNVAGFTKLFRL
jgi:2-methylcitrate dehydratase PrpD